MRFLQELSRCGACTVFMFVRRVVEESRLCVCGGPLCRAQTPPPI